MGLLILSRCLFPGLFVPSPPQRDFKVRWFRNSGLVLATLVVAGSIPLSSSHDGWQKIGNTGKYFYHKETVQNDLL